MRLFCPTFTSAGGRPSPSADSLTALASLLLHSSWFAIVSCSGSTCRLLRTDWSTRVAVPLPYGAGVATAASASAWAGERGSARRPTPCGGRQRQRRGAMSVSRALLGLRQSPMHDQCAAAYSGAVADLHVELGRLGGEGAASGEVARLPGIAQLV